MYRNVTLVLAETEIIMAKADSEVTIRGARAAASAKKTVAFAEVGREWVGSGQGMWVGSGLGVGGSGLEVSG